MIKPDMSLIEYAKHDKRVPSYIVKEIENKVKIKAIPKKELDSLFKRNEHKNIGYERKKITKKESITITTDMLFYCGYRLPEHKHILKIRHQRPKEFANYKVPADKTIEKLLKYDIIKTIDGCLIYRTETECKHGYRSAIKVKTGTNIDISPMNKFEERKSRNNATFRQLEKKNIDRIQRNKNKVVIDIGFDWGDLDYSDLIIELPK